MVPKCARHAEAVARVTVLETFPLDATHSACQVTVGAPAFPGFPAELGGFYKLHAAFLDESRTRGC